jgi:hypothetical protein
LPTTKRIISLTVEWRLQDDSDNQSDEFESFRTSLQRTLNVPPLSGSIVDCLGPKQTSNHLEYTLRIEASAPRQQDGIYFRQLLGDVVHEHRGQITALQTLLSSDELKQSLGVDDETIIDSLIRSLRVNTMRGLAAKTNEQIRKILKSNASQVIAALEEYRAAHPKQKSPRRHRSGRREPANKQI